MLTNIFVIRDSSNREKKYQKTIKDLTENLGIVKYIKEDVDEIKKFVYKNKRSRRISEKDSKSSTDVKEKQEGSVGVQDERKI